jgi:protoporphyrinogen IX oxidase
MDKAYLLALHIIFIVTWFSGLFYIVRLFIYQVEANEKTETEKSILIPQYQLMQKRLWYGITWPSAILTLAFGTWLLSLNFAAYLSLPWMHLKLAFVGLLFVYQLRCQQIFRQMQRNAYRGTSLRLRIFNEIATVFLFAIVFLVVVKSSGGFVWGMLGLVILSAVILAGVFIYKKQREKNPPQS